MDIRERLQDGHLYLPVVLWQGGREKFSHLTIPLSYKKRVSIMVTMYHIVCMNILMHNSHNYYVSLELTLCMCGVGPGKSDGLKYSCLKVQLCCGVLSLGFSFIF